MSTRCNGKCSYPDCRHEALPLCRLCHQCESPAHHLCQIEFENEHGLPEQQRHICYSCYGGTQRAPGQLNQGTGDTNDQANGGLSRQEVASELLTEYGHIHDLKDPNYQPSDGDSDLEDEGTNDCDLEEEGEGACQARVN